MEWDDRCAVENKDIGCFGSHVANIYTIKYNAEDGTGQTATLENDATTGPTRKTTLNNLMSNTKYTFTIEIESNGYENEVFSDVSQPKIGATSTLDCAATTRNENLAYSLDLQSIDAIFIHFFMRIGSRSAIKSFVELDHSPGVTFGPTTCLKHKNGSVKFLCQGHNKELSGFFSIISFLW